MKFIPYLTFKGDCEAAFTFYAEVLGGRIEAMMKHRGSPVEKDVPAAWLDSVMHARLSVGDQVLMASDSPPEHYQPQQGMHVSLILESDAEAERVYAALAQDAKQITMSLQETFWATRFAMLVDRFGTPWMINCMRPMTGA